MRNTEKGISLVMINTEKGQKAFENIKSEIAFQETLIFLSKKKSNKDHQICFRHKIYYYQNPLLG